MMQDIVFAWRLCRRTPVFTAAIVITLAIGIGLNGGIFTIINGLVFSARVEKDPSTFVHLIARYSDEYAALGQKEAFTTNDFQAYLNEAQSLTNISAWQAFHARLNEQPQQTLGMLVTCNFFSLYGLEQPLKGRLFQGDECVKPNGPPVAILSEEIWQSRFSAEADIIGKTINLDDTPYVVVGLLRASFPGRLRGPGIWVPWTAGAQFYGKSVPNGDLFHQNNYPWLSIEGRLRPDVSRSSALADLSVIAARQDSLHPRRMTSLLLTNGSMAQDPDQQVSARLLALMVMLAATLVLLAVSANVTTLLWSRAVERRAEMALRLGLGADRASLVRMLAVEAFMIAGLAGFISAVLMYQIPRIFVSALPIDAPYYPVKISVSVFVYLIVLIALVASVIGVAPAMESLRINFADLIKGQINPTASRSRIQTWLTVLQVTASLVLLVVAGAFLRLQRNINSIDPGFEVKQVLMATLDFHGSVAETRVFYRTLEREVRGLPGVQSLSFVTSAPFIGAVREQVLLPGQAAGTGRTVIVDYVSDTFFETLRVPILLGRSFVSSDVTSDSSLPVAIVSKSFSSAFWLHESPLGKTIRCADGRSLQIIGVAQDTRSEQYGVIDGPRLYRLQSADVLGGPLMIRFTGDSDSLARMIATKIKNLDPTEKTVPRTLASTMADLSNQLSIIARFIMGLAVMAVFLAVIGVYAIVSFSLRQRIKEIGVRVALGANRNDIFRAVVLWGAKPIAIGSLFGMAVAFPGLLVLSKVLASVPDAQSIYVNPLDPLTLLMVGLILVIINILATLGPALTAVSLDPARILHDQ